MALFHTTVLDNQIKALDTIGTVSGSIATFDTDRAERLVNLEVAITATQSGSGTPSPSNPRTINGFSACNLSVNGTTETIPFGQTVYGGRLNVGSGVLTITHGYISDLGALNWVYNTSRTSPFFVMPDIISPSEKRSTNGEPFLCSFYSEQINANDIWNGTKEGMCVGSNGIASNYHIVIRDTDYTDVPTFKTALSGQSLVYELATPTTIQLDSKQIQAIIGTNNVYSDTGDIIDLKFILSVGKAIS